MHHLYLSIQNNAAAIQQEREALVAWCEANGVGEYMWIEDRLTMGRITDRLIMRLIAGVQKGDTVVASDISRLGRSLSMLATVLTELYRREVNVITLEGRTLATGRTMAAFTDSLNEIVAIERNMRAYRSNEVVFVKRGEGLPIGRPKGAKKAAEKNVLYGKSDELERLRAQGLSLQRIADHLGVSKGTIANYLKTRQLPE